jgi:hypothetical protein
VVELPVPAWVILRATSGSYVQSRLRVRAVIWKVSPAVTEALDESEPYHKQLPAVELSHIDQWVYVSVAATLVHSTVADAPKEPEAAALNVTSSRVVSVAALLVPASPGSPVCNLMYVLETENDCARSASNNLFSA